MDFRALKASNPATGTTYMVLYNNFGTHEVDCGVNHCLVSLAENFLRLLVALLSFFQIKICS